MKSQTIDKAEVEAIRFIRACRAVRSAKRKNQLDACRVEKAALKRASMDLTRMLANMRQGR